MIPNKMIIVVNVPANNAAIVANSKILAAETAFVSSATLSQYLSNKAEYDNPPATPVY
jgi:hypothetical protein